MKADEEAMTMTEETTNIGQLRLILSVRDLDQSVEFYTRMGFKHHDTKYWNKHFATLQYQDFVLALMQGVIPQDMMLHFLSHDWSEVDHAVEILEEKGLNLNPAGPENRGAFIEDPDGNAIYLSQP